jgi:CubicO group peptidase (beta-lactamase class C family)
MRHSATSTVGLLANPGLSAAATGQLEAALELALELGEVGLQVAAHVRGEPVLEAWTGSTDEASGHPVTRDTVFPVFSVSKAATALSVHVQAERGRLDLDDPVARHWPEFGRRGKADITIRDVLSHQAGIPFMPPAVTPESMTDWDWMVEQIADLKPAFAPRKSSAYMAMTFGWLLGEVVRRTDPAHRPFGRFVQDEICAPLGMDHFWLGVPRDRPLDIATLVGAGGQAQRDDSSPAQLAMPSQVALVPEVFNRRDVQEACIPAVGGVGSAGSLVKLFGAVANGGALAGHRLVSPETVQSLRIRRPPFDRDEVLTAVPPAGMGGYWVGGLPVTGMSESIVFLPAAGGSLGWADLETGLGVTIVHNRMFQTVPEGRPHPFAAIVDAVHTCAGELDT